MKATLIMLMMVSIFLAVNLYAQDNNISELRMKIQKMDDTFNKAMLKGDYTTITNLYTDDAISLPSYEPMWRGKDAILAGNKKDLESMKFHSFTTKITDVYSSGDLAYEIGTFEATFTMPNMTNEIKDHGKYLTIWQKQSDGSWKDKVDTWNSDVNPMSMNQAGAKSKDDYGK